jgi:allantoicase
VTLAEIDTSLYIGNAPGAAALAGLDASSLTGALSGWVDDGAWFRLLPRTGLLPDTPHRFRLADTRPVTHVRLDVFPDGGIARLRLPGTLTEAGLAGVRRRWAQTSG